jgi:protein gp37
MGELFDASVPWSWIEEVLATAGEAGWHTFQFLTKQPHIARHYAFPENAWAGVTVENGKYDSLLRLYRFAGVQASVRFLSFEPLMGPAMVIPEFVNWVIVGAMTGPGAIKPKPEWVQGIIDEADSRGIPVFLKDNLNWPEIRREWPE